ncbi:MAG: hypothetical protein Q9227_003779 [Pyrenula ochraceoflavens]
MAVGMIVKQCKHLKYRRKIVLVTNGSGRMDANDVDMIIERIKADNMELVVLGVDFDDAEYGLKEEDKPQTKVSRGASAANEQILRSVVEACDGTFGTLAEAIDELGIPRLKTVKPIASYKDKLTFGDPENYDTAISIDVERYPKVMVLRAPTASSYVEVQSQDSLGSADTVRPDDNKPQEEGQLANVRSNYIYEIPDGDGQKKEVDRDQLAKGYEYGRTAVHIDETDENITKMETTSGLDIVGFISQDKYQRYMTVDHSHMVIAQRADQEATLALSSMIRALFTNESHAVARLVTKDGRDPEMVLLAPLLEPDFECLIEYPLPFTEDIRSYQFPPLDEVVTVSGKRLTEHRNLPSKDLLTAMSDYVDGMDLSSAGRDEEGNASEYLSLEDIHSPLYHRIDQVVRRRATHPHDPIPPPPAAILKASHPPGELLQHNQNTIQRLAKAANVKKVPPKVKGRRRNREIDKPISGLDIDSLLGEDTKQRQTISATNAIPEFKRYLEHADEPEAISDATNQMVKIIEDKISSSYADLHYQMALEMIGALRKELVEYEEPGLYNDAIRSLKEKILEEKLGGNRKEMWYLIRNARLGLIDKKQSEASKIDEQEAKAFLEKK